MHDINGRHVFVHKESVGSDEWVCEVCDVPLEKYQEHAYGPIVATAKETTHANV